ncbi:MAG: FadR/GntR family transcriptional regulator [Tropicimonas sp.]|uniref:FadR/GntR family transcriptional regulator n=1 Tax=Tropicimonas sp. TaxID=2067044 RepID=UPI003A894242
MRQQFPTRKSLTDEVTSAMIESIQAGELKPGEKLPTGHELATAHGVSLTVVREAMSRLRSEGLVVSRQGAGVFVAEPNARRPFRLVKPAGSGEPAISDVYELRMGVEVVAAGLAAKRRTEAQLAAIEKSLDKMKKALDDGEEAVDEDLGFHKALAAATGNTLFLSFIEFIGSSIRHSIAVSRNAGDNRDFSVVYEEHQAIFQKVKDQDDPGAQKAMQAHMEMCLVRCH